MKKKLKFNKKSKRRNIYRSYLELKTEHKKTQEAIELFDLILKTFSITDSYKNKNTSL